MKLFIAFESFPVKSAEYVRFRFPKKSYVISSRTKCNHFFVFSKKYFYDIPKKIEML